MNTTSTLKVTLTLLLATCFTTAAFAFNEGRLTISHALETPVQIVIDNRTYTASPSSHSLVLDDVRPGQHTVRIYERKRGGRVTGSRNTLLYSGTVYVKPNYHVDIMINRFGKALVDEAAISDRYRHDGPYRDNDSWYGDRDRDYREPMTHMEFDQLVQRIKTKWFPNDKLTLAKDAASHSYFSTAQVKSLVGLFQSDADKLELAKAAYRHTVDRSRYYELFDLFAFQSSRNELEQYLKNNRF